MAISLATEAAGAGKYPASRFNKKDRMILSAVKTYVDAQVTLSYVAASDATTTAGGAAAEVVSVAGVLAGDKVVWSILDAGTNSVTGVSAVAGAGQITFTFSGDPAADTIISYLVLRQG